MDDRERHLQVTSAVGNHCWADISRKTQKWSMAVIRLLQNINRRSFRFATLLRYLSLNISETAAEIS